ncbi:HNH endonuclease [Klebsiella grimontii]|uniref:HNH endonuclease n=1 Tax=Klebsiella grimontii TaxID=2058152 RepID=UPI00398387FD
MNRKQFIQSRGATCRNWTWSWSFINHDDQLVIFGAWDVERDQERAVILREAWEYNARLRKNPGYTQAVEHIGYILGGYDLYTFNMVQATSPDAPDVAVIQDFERRLEKRFLRKEGAVCQCCGFDFEKTWGEHGKGFIHVHHIRPLRTLGPDYQIDPVNELVPLCPNCHAMIHRGNEAKPLSVEELRAMMRPSG